MAEERYAVPGSQSLPTSQLIFAPEKPIQTISGFIFFTQGCSDITFASGRELGSLMKHNLKKSFRSSEMSSGSGGIASSTIRKRTIPRDQRYYLKRVWDRHTTHAVGKVSVRRFACEQLDDRTSQRPGWIRLRRLSYPGFTTYPMQGRLHSVKSPQVPLKPCQHTTPLPSVRTHSNSEFLLHQKQT